MPEKTHIALASDDAGLELKEKARAYLTRKGIEVEDFWKIDAIDERSHGEKTL